MNQERIALGMIETRGLIGSIEAADAMVKAADVTLIDPNRPFVFSEADIRSKSRNTPFLGRELPGRAVLTMVGGEVRFCHESLAGG